MTAGWSRGVLRGRGAPAVPDTIIKFGGSLLARPAWPDDLRTLLADFTGPTTIVVGGGAVVDGLRSIDAASPRAADVMHRLAIEAMGITARLVAEAAALPFAVEPARGDRAVVLDAAAWLASGRRSEDLPVGWHVTSDSIAAVVAAESGSGLVLAKSLPPPAAGGDLATLARHGWIDDHFPIAAARLPRIEWAAAATINPTSSR